MNNLKTVISIPWALSDDSIYSRYWGGRNRIRDEQESYIVPLIYRAVRMRCNSLTRVPRYIYNEAGDEVPYAFEANLPMRQLLWWSEAALLLKGAAWLLKLKNRFRYGKGLQWLNPFTVQYKYDKGELLFWQQLPTGERFPSRSQYWTADDFIYIKEFNPYDDLGPGISAAESSLLATSTSFSTDRFLSNFFASDALPITMVMLPEGTQQPEVERVEGWFKRKMRELKGAQERVIGVKGEIKTEKLTAELKTFDFPSIDNHVLEQVSHAFELPKTMLSSASANYATAQVERRIYIEDTIIPRCLLYEEMLNPFLAEVGQRIEFAPQELSEMQEDETMRSNALKTLVDTGIPLEAALDMLGYDLSDEALALIKKALKEKEKQKEQMPVPTNGTPQPTNGEDQNDSEAQIEAVEEDDEDEEDEQKRVDLEKWHRKARKRLVAGKSAQCEFVSDNIPVDVRDEVYRRLQDVMTEDELKAVFKEQEAICPG